jgi:hypothetical protein
MVRTSDHTMLGEIRAMLNRLLDGAAYQQAIETEQRAFTTANSKTSARG